MSFKTIGMLVGLFLLVGVFATSFASAGSAIIKTVPVQKVWKADGVTEYRMEVYADNTGLNGDATQGIQWAVVAPQGLAPYMTMTRAVSAKQSPLFDFFHGNSMWDMVTADWSLQGRVIMNPVSNSQGLVASYWFTVSPNAPVGKTNFDLGDVAFANDQTSQPFVVQNGQFVISNIPQKTAVSTSSGAQIACPAGNNC